MNTLTATRAGKQINIITPVAKELGGIGYVYLAAREKTLNDPERRAAIKKYVKASSRAPAMRSRTRTTPPRHW